MLPVRLRQANRNLNRSNLGDFENLLDQFWNWSRPAGIYGGYDVDIWDDADHIYLEAELPGISKKDLEISVANGVLNIQGEKKQEKKEKDHTHHLQERYYGSFSRSFTLPSTVDTSKVEATLKEGVLRIVLNKREEVKARRIEVVGQ